MKYASLLAGDRLHLVLMPTERCNFRCVYCYEDFQHGRMRPETVRGICRLLERRAPALKSLAIEWFGGEPLIEPGIIEEIQGRILRLEGRNPTMKASARATTNGYLLSKAMLQRMVSFGVGAFQISLDGPASEHDCRRVRADGSGTFETIWSHLIAARQSDLEFEILLRVHVDRENAPAMNDFLERLAGEFAEDDRFKVWIRPITRLGGPRDALLPILGEADHGVVPKLRAHAAELGLKLTDYDSAICYASAANSFVIRSTGEIAKCTVALRHAKNRLGRIDGDGIATVDGEKMKGWVRGLLTGDAKALQCPKKGFADSASVSL